MREIYIKELDRKIILDEEDYDFLYGRFDLRRKTQCESEGFVIDRPCICDRYEDCVGCPLYPCQELIQYFDKDNSIVFSRFNIFWEKRNDEKAKEIIRKIRKTLKSMKKIEKNENNNRT